MTVAAIRPAATVLLLRDCAAGLEVFMVRRHHLMGFAGDALVFPGGRIDPADADLAAAATLCPALPGVDAVAMSSRVGALRETFEESGVLLARDQKGLIDGARVAALEKDRQDIAVSAARFAELLRRESLVLAVDLLVPFAHWVTPPIYAKRYDTVFFLAAAPAGQAAVHDGTESVDSCWITPQRALAAGDSVSMRLEFPTRRNLEKLGLSTSVDGALAAARRGPIVTVLPEILEGPAGRTARLPTDAGYGGPLFDFRDKSPVTQQTKG